MTFDDFRKIVSELSNLPLEDIEKDSSFRDDLGVDSMQLVNLICEVAERFKLELGSIDKIDDVLTVGSMYRTFMKGEILIG
ncbi:acyl carrier protein [Metabacillus bambusae]|uniref:Acyl carrier protein n=1 Tax=Metabacillus bambusae TaxID=2795218 RepID=A0ABS3N6L6_9BACI|nr:acyl carrier protein [Metabacillus bambusae]MBO1513937.1 acyl carrier protein [Metabacillus bambusae]